MKNSILLVLILSLLGLSGCGGGNKATSKKQSRTGISNDSYEPKTAQASIFDEDIEAFVLEEDDLFGSFSQDNYLAQHEGTQELPFSWEATHEDATQTFQTVLFDYDSSRIPPTEQPKMQENTSKAKALSQDGKTIVCKGKACKWRGTETYNLALSDQRAQSVAKELKQQGIARQNIKAFGVGTKESHAQGDSKEAHANDRCVTMYTLSI